MSDLHLLMSRGFYQQEIALERVFGRWTEVKIERAIKHKIEYITTNDPELCLFLKRRARKSSETDHYLTASKTL